jgi:hypothetical protein
MTVLEPSTALPSSSLDSIRFIASMMVDIVDTLHTSDYSDVAQLRRQQQQQQTDLPVLYILPAAMMMNTTNPPSHPPQQQQ